MVTKLSHTSLFVNDQDKAYDFYVKKLGFNVHTDATMDNGFRWLFFGLLFFQPGHIAIVSRSETNFFFK